jgi:polyhydroxyalkanoate synthesis regulator phasin
MFPTASGGDEKAVRNPREEYGRVQKELKAMVDAGKISEEDARRRLSGFRERLGRGAGDKPAADGDPDAKRKLAYDGFERRIKAAVANGDMTREEAAEKLKAFKERLSSRRGPGEDKVKDGDGRDRTRGDAEKSDSDRADSDVEKIYAAVKAGKLTREEAGKKLRALKSKKASGGGKDKKESRDRGDGATTPTRDF